MEAPSHRAKPSQRTTHHCHHLHQRSLSPSGRFCSSTIAASAPQALTRREIPTARVAISRSPSPSAVRFAAPHHQTRAKKMTCMCSPTTHPGSFRCSLHKSSRFPAGYNGQNARKNHHHGHGVSGTASYQLNIARRSAMTNSLVRIGTVEGDLVKRALAALIRPSSHSQRRREDFKPRPSRLSVMARAEDS